MNSSAAQFNKQHLIRRVLCARSAGFLRLRLSLPQLLNQPPLRAEDTAHGTLFGKAKNLIWLYMAGGPSQYETFDPKPHALRRSGESLILSRQTLPACRSVNYSRAWPGLWISWRLSARWRPMIQIMNREAIGSIRATSMRGRTCVP